MLRDPEQVGIGGGGGTKCFHRRHAEIDHQLEFLRVLAMRVDGRVGAESDLHARLHGVAEHLGTCRRRRPGLRLQHGRVGFDLRHDVLCGHQRRDKVRSFAFHELKRFRLEK